MTIVAGGGADDGGSELSGGSVDPVGLEGVLVGAGFGAQATTPAPMATTSTILRNMLHPPTRTGPERASTVGR